MSEVSLTSPAELLEGRKLDGGWTVGKLVKRNPLATGGNFSVGYLAHHDDGRSGYLKALNLRAAMLGGGDVVNALRSMTTAFEWERDVCRRCTNKKLTHVVHALSDGQIKTNPSDALSVVPYLIFELASGDIRSHIDKLPNLELAWALRSVHNAAVGIRQLHQEQIGHQDIKPSNVMVFNDRLSKIGDLGRSCSENNTSPYDHLPIAGDMTYAPPELLYGAIPDSVEVLRYGCDLYQLGSLLTFLFTQSTINALLAKNLKFSHHWTRWGDSFEEVLPFVLNAFTQCLESIEPDIPEFARKEVITAISQLSFPDPRRRGHPLSPRGDRMQFSLERYISLFDTLSRKAEIKGL